MKKKCMICGKEVEGEKLGRMNAASACFFEGQTIWVKGHRTCLKNIWDLVVIPNRRRQYEWEKEFRRGQRERLNSTLTLIKEIYGNPKALKEYIKISNPRH